MNGPINVKKEFYIASMMRAFTIFVGGSKKRGQLEDLCVDGIMLKWIFKK
jgi:hypothetical protein